MYYCQAFVNFFIALLCRSKSPSWAEAECSCQEGFQSLQQVPAIVIYLKILIVIQDQEGMVLVIYICNYHMFFEEKLVKERG